MIEKFKEAIERGNVLSLLTFPKRLIVIHF